MEDFDIKKKSTDIEKSLADVMKLEKQKREARIASAELEESSLKIALQLQTLTDAIQGGLRSANLKEYRNTIVFNEADSLDADNPFLMDFEVISETTKIVSIKLSFKIKNFRAYAKSAKDGGGVVKSTSEGGGVVKSTSEGGADTRTTEDGGADTRTTEDGGSATPTSSYITTPSGGGHSSAASSKDTDCYLLLGVVPHDVGYLVETYYGPTTTTPGDHTHIVYHHTHPQHRHTVTILAHKHTVTILAHDHTVTLEDHDHTVTLEDHDHTVTLEDHDHEINFGIHEEETSPTIQVFISRDNGKTYSLPLGSYTFDQQLDITRFIDTVGEKVIKFESDVRCRISARVLLKLDIKAR